MVGTGFGFAFAAEAVRFAEIAEVVVDMGSDSVAAAAAVVVAD